MRSHKKQSKIRHALGIESCTWLKNDGRQSTWLVQMKNGDSFTVVVATLATETGVLREAAKVLKNSPVIY